MRKKLTTLKLRTPFIKAVLKQWKASYMVVEEIYDT